MRRRAYRRRVLGVRLAAALTVLAALLGAAASTTGRPVRGASRCPVFPRDNAWNRRVDRLPVAAGSDRIIATIGVDRPVHADFGSGRYNGGPIGIPYTTVSKRQPRVPVRFQYADESDRGPYPIPRSAPVEGGRRSTGDRHVIVVDRDRCRLYELFAAEPVAGGRRWRAGSGAVGNLRSHPLRPARWASPHPPRPPIRRRGPGGPPAAAAARPPPPGRPRKGAARGGTTAPALRSPPPRPRRAYVSPPRHYASSSDDPDLPPMGLRVRLKASFDVS